MINYVAIYGFLRNLVLIFVCASWYYIFPKLIKINLKSNVNWEYVYISLGLMILSFISFMAYMKFYRRYSLEGLMLLSITEDQNLKLNKIK